MLELTLMMVAPRRSRSGSTSVEADRYLGLASPGLSSSFTLIPNEEAFFEMAGAQAGRGPRRPAAATILFDSRGEMVSSEGFAEILLGLRDGGTQRLLLGIGPANGWSEAARKRAGRLISFGRITLPHELARLVAAEQIYRASTILAGHPYHLGH